MRMTIAGHATRLVAALTLALGLGVVALPPAAALAADVEFGQGTAEATFGEGLEFTIPVTLAAAPQRVELLLTFPDALGPHVTPVATPGAGSTTLRHRWDLRIDGHLVPNTPLEVRWRVTPPDGAPVLSPPTRVVYADTRIDWQTVEGDVVRVHWHAGDEAFGRRALEIGERAVRETTELLGVTEDEPIDFFIYADEATFREALGPGTRENVGGQAHADIRTLFALIGPGDIDAGWVSVVVPHELVHLVFDTTVDNPYRFPPRWLNEGLAVYLSQGYDAGDRARVEAAAESGAIIPLTGLVGQFPTTFGKFALAYAESASAVDHLVSRHGRDALVGLVRSYADGLSDDDAFRRAIGMDVAAFEAGWLEAIGAEPPVAYGPRPAPPGPLPGGWSEVQATPVPGTEPDPVTSPGPDAPRPGAEPAPDAPGVPAITFAALAVLAALGVAAVVLRARRTA